MSIKKLSNNKYKISIECGYDILGKRTRKTEVFIGTSSQAKIREGELLKKYYHKGSTLNLNELVFKDFSELFLDKYCKDNISNIAIRNYKQMLKRINSLIGNLKLKKITTIMLDTMYKKIKMGVKGKELAPKTMLHYYNLVNLMFNQAIKWNLVEVNPNSDAKKPKLEKKKRNFYDDENIENLLSSLKEENIKYKALITLAFDSGARRSEICALRWSDVDFENATIFIDNSLKVINGVVDEEKAKTESSIRSVYLSNSTIEVLKEYKKWQEEYSISRGKSWKTTDRVFTSINGTHMHPDTCGKIINKVLTKHNLPKLTFHELRHTCTTALLENGVNPEVVRDRLGHADTRVTMEIYAHVYEKTKKKSASVLDNFIVNA